MVLVFLFFSFLPAAVGAKTLPPNFKVTNEMIYQQLMELKEEHAVFKEKFNSIERRFKEIDRRFEQIDKRFEQVDKRFEELRADMNRRFDDMFHYLNILAAIFTTFTVSILGFAIWDRRTIVAKAKEETIKELENSGKLKDLITVLRKKAETDLELEKILREHRLL